jgi:hypothetical protein
MLIFVLQQDGLTKQIAERDSEVPRHVPASTSSRRTPTFLTACSAEARLLVGPDR